MQSSRQALALVAVLLAVGLIPVLPTATYAQSTVCDGPPREATGADLGSPDAEGVTLPNARLISPGERLAYRFTVPGPRTGFVYVGDQWYDLDLALYSIASGQNVACWQTTTQQRFQRRQVQFVRPRDQIVEGLEPGVYVLTVGLAPGATFDPARRFTVRVALGPPLCGGLDPPNLPSPTYPGLTARADGAWYQLGMSFQPERPGRFDLVSFNAFVSPPYTDLFEFHWELDGQPVPGANGASLQIPSADLLGGLSSGAHTMRATARGARPYPDPAQPQVPPTLSVNCTFQVGP